MFHQLSSTTRSRALQMHQIASWCQPKLARSNAVDCATVRRHCARLLTLSESTIDSLSPKEAGALHFILRRCIFTLAIFIVQVPTTAQVRIFNAEIQRYIEARCPNVEICDTSLRELAVFIHTVMRLQCQDDPEYKADLRELRDIQTYGQICKAARINRKIVIRIQRAIFHELLPALHKQYDLKDMVAFSCAFQREGYHQGIDFPLPLIAPNEFDVDETEGEYDGVFEHVELSTFCKFVWSVPKGTECSVCITEIDGTEDKGDEQPISTKCGHTFHKVCLDKWVNDSGMKASDTCPSCRTVLCGPRERQHEPLEAHSDGRIDAEEEESPTNASSIQRVVTVLPRRRVHVQWLETRIAAHLNSETRVF